MSSFAMIFCLILTGGIGLVGCFGFHPRSRGERVAVACGFTAFLLALLSAYFHREWVRGVRHEWAVVTQAGNDSRAHLVPGGREISLCFDRPLRMGEEVEILVVDDDGHQVGFPIEDERPAFLRVILFGAASAALFSWGVFRLRRLGPDPVDPPSGPPGTGINPS